MILVTGFERWEEVPDNPTSQIVEQLKANDVVGKVLPVSFSKAGLMVENLVKEYRPEAIINLGLAPERATIRVERVAINLIDARVPDNDGVKPVDEPIDPLGPVAYMATIPTREIVESVRSRGIPAFLSYSAGTYLCNFVMYKTLRTVDKLELGSMAGFIHVPYSSEIASEMDKPVPNLPLRTLLEAVKIALDVVRRAISSSRS